MRKFGFVSLAALSLLAACAHLAQAQTYDQNHAMPELRDAYYGRVNTFGVLASYSNDSSHILLGVAENRRLLNFGAKYERRIWIGRVANWMYDGEILPVALESDPVVHTVVNFTSPTTSTLSENTTLVYACHPSSGSFSETVGTTNYAYNYVNTCRREWTIGEGISPVGFEWNFMPRRRLQPFAVGHGGYMYSTQAIPVANAGSFNFTFDFGFGLELFRSKSQSMPGSVSRSVRAEYRYHHISNHDTAQQNPGIDNGIFQLTYAFGK